MADSFERLFAATSDAAFINRGDRVEAANAAAADLYGVPVDQIVGRLISDLVPDDIADSLEARTERHARGAERDRLTTEAILRPDGTRVPVQVRSMPIERDGDALLVLIREVGSPTHVEPDIDAERAELFTTVSLRLAAAADDELDAIITDVLGQIAQTEDVDRAYVIEFVGDDQPLITCTHEWCAEGIDAQIHYVQNLPLGDFTYSVDLVRDGEVFYAPNLAALPPEADAERESFGIYGVQSVLQVPMRASGKTFGVAGFNSVRRARTWSDDQIALLQAVTDAMATAIVRRRAYLEAQRARSQAEAANEAKNHFLSRVSHELRTPLNAVLGFTELLLLDDRPDDDREALEQISSSGGFLLGLVEDLLDISRIESGNLSLSTEPVDVTDAIGAAQAMVASAGIDDGVTVQVDIAEDLPLVFADLQRLRQVVVNLLSNACKYNVEGGIVEVSAHRATDRRVAIVVRDTGIGIEPEKLDRVFEPFDRLDREHTGVEGTGIGLTVTRSLVELMGGTISLTSILGAGTTVTVELETAGTTAPRRGDDTGGAELDRHLVAVLDPSAGSRALVRHIASGLDGVDVVDAATTNELLDLFDDRLPALLFAEVDDGTEHSRFLEVFERDARFRRVSVVMVTTSTHERTVRRAVEAGVVDYLAKPVPFERLRTMMRTYTG